MIHFALKWLILACTCLGVFPACAEDIAIPRTVIALYNPKMLNDISDSAIHQFAEMPLNHLGYRVWFYDINEVLPDLTGRPDIHGVVTWFPGGMTIPDPVGYLKWASKIIDDGKKFVILGNPGFYDNDGSVPPDLRNVFWSKLGLYDQVVFVSATYDVSLIKLDSTMVDFERSYGGILPGFHTLKGASTDTKVHLAARTGNDPGTDSILVATHPSGGYVAEEYEVYWDNISDSNREWYINPFLFFKLAFGDNKGPIPDTTTLVGRRIFYHHIDGDGWISRTNIAEYRKDRALCAEVIYRDVLKAFPDLPCTVAPIAADLDDAWVGTAESRRWAKEILALPNVEAGCHTYSHPFQWGFFADYTMEKEEPFLYLYPFGSWSGTSLWVRLKHYAELFLKKQDLTPSYDGSTLDQGYDLPRAYANKPFNLHREVYGAIDEINKLAPPDKHVVVYQWSGDCLPFEAAVADTRSGGLLNLNGGNTRFDSESRSYGWVRPIGRQVVGQRQIYASNSNENIYTDNWTSHFYNFNLLPQTFQNTNTPVRVKPMNLYYHMFSGERRPALEALLQNIAYIRDQEIVPIKMSAFAAMGDGFYQVEIYNIGKDQYRVSNRGAIATVRFDNAIFGSVDFARSQGVLGQRHFQGSLYVALDPSVNEPIVALQDCPRCDVAPFATIPYLVESRWEIWDAHADESPAVTFMAKGYGQGRMTWHVPKPGTYVVTITSKTIAPITKRIDAIHPEISFSIGEGSILEPINVKIERAL